MDAVWPALAGTGHAEIALRGIEDRPVRVWLDAVAKFGTADDVIVRLESAADGHPVDADGYDEEHDSCKVNGQDR